MLRKIAEMARPLMWRLPAPLQWAPRMWRWEFTSRLAGDLGVTAMAVQTEDGFILSKVQDRTVLPWLAKERSFGVGPQSVMEKFKQTLAGGGTYLDIGANLGVTTIPLVRQGGINIHAFEPDPVNYRMLVANLAINCPEHKVALHEFALGDQDGALAFELNPTNPGDNRLAGSGGALMGEEGWHHIEVQVRRLDDVVEHFTKPLVVKMDVQGAEARVAAGGRRTLAQASLMSIEWCPYLLNRVGGDPEAAISLVEAFPRASMVLGDSDEAPNWRSGRDVAKRMRDVLKERADRFLYYEVQAEK